MEPSFPTQLSLWTPHPHQNTAWGRLHFQHLLLMILSSQDRSGLTAHRDEVETEQPKQPHSHHP